MFASLVLSMAAATKKRKEKKKLTLGRLALVAGTKQALSNLFLRLSISMEYRQHLKTANLVSKVGVFPVIYVVPNKSTSS